MVKKEKEEDEEDEEEEKKEEAEARVRLPCPSAHFGDPFSLLPLVCPVCLILKSLQVKPAS